MSRVPCAGQQVLTSYPFPCSSAGKQSACNVEDLGSIPGSGRKWQPTPELLPREFHGQRSPGQAAVHGIAKSWTRLCDFQLYI